MVWRGLREDLVCRNRHEVMGVLHDQLEAGAPDGIDRMEMIERGEHVVVGFGGPGLRDVADIPLQGRIFQVLTFDGDRIVRMQDYLSRDEALAAAGADDWADRG